MLSTEPVTPTPLPYRGFAFLLAPECHEISVQDLQPEVLHRYP